MEVTAVADYQDPANDIFELEDLNKEAVLKLLRNAYYDAEIENNDVRVNERRRFYITAQPEQKWLALSSYFVFKAGASEADKLAYVNVVNDSLPILRACISKSTGNLIFDWYLSVDGGVTRRSIIYALRRFLEYIDKAFNLDDKDVV